MAKIYINKKHKRTDGYGFALIDNSRNVTMFYYNQPFLQLPDEIAMKFADRKDIDIKYDNPLIAKTKKEVESSKLTETQIWKLTKNQQIAMLRNLGYIDKIPRFEKGRVDLILKLQG